MNALPKSSQLKRGAAVPAAPHFATLLLILLTLQPAPAQTDFARPVSSSEFDVNTITTSASAAKVTGEFNLDTRVRTPDLAGGVTGVFEVDTRGGLSSPLQITGAVSSSTGAIIAGAKVELMRLGQVFWEGASGADGFFRPPALVAQSYTVRVTKQGFTTLGLNMAGETGGARFLELVMRPAPAAPATQTTERQPTQEEKGQAPQPVVVPQESPEPQLKIFNGTNAFVPVEATGPNSLRTTAMTVVMTHGIFSDPEEWALELASLIKNHHALSEQPNLVAWDWRGVLATAEALRNGGTVEGRRLGQALRRRLGYESYVQPIHFIGHSFGTLVNRYACDDAHQRGDSNVGEAGFDPALTRPHITLLDEGEVASIFGSNVTTAAQVAAMVAEWKGGLVNGVRAAYKDWKSPIPVTPAAWIDSYISMVGVQRSEAVNVCLTAPAIGVWNPLDAHSYAHLWYRNSVLPPWPSVGFRQGRENGTALPPAGNGLTPGSLWFENLNQQMTLNLDPDPTTLECTISILGTYVVLTPGVLLENVGQAVLDRYVTKINYLGERGADLIIRGQHYAVVAKEKVGEGADAAKDAAIDTWNWINPVKNIRSLASPDFRIEMRSPNRGLREVATEPSVWLTADLPENAGMLQFDFTVTGAPASDRIVCAVGGQNVFNLPAIYAPQGEIQSTDMVDISQHAGQQVELFFGLAGGTSRGCELAIEGIRFITIPQPTLVALDAGDHLELKWPAAATGWTLERSDDLSTWAAVPEAANATTEQGVLTLGLPRSPGRNFFRLRRVE